jgi:hypothetical protein
MSHEVRIDMLTRLIIGTAMVFGATVAAADGGDHGAQEVTLEGLQAKCAEFVANDQLRPVKVTITCDQLGYVWREAEPEASQLANTLSVGAKVRAKGMEVAHEFFPTATEATPVSCMKFVKVEQKVGNVDQEITCAELPRITDLLSFCQPVIADRIAQDPGALTERVTEEVISICPTAGGH